MIIGSPEQIPTLEPGTPFKVAYKKKLQLYITDRFVINNGLYQVSGNLYVPETELKLLMKDEDV